MYSNRLVFLYICALFFLLVPPVLAQEKHTSKDAIKELKIEIQKLRDQMETERRAYEAQLKKMQEKIDAVSRQILKKDTAVAEAELESEIAESAKEVPASEGWSSIGRAMQSLNPDISVIVDTYYHNRDAPSDDVGEVLEGMAGFGHSHGHGHDHEHAALEEGFNMRHLELYFSAEVDPYLKGYAIAAVSENNAEMEEAVIQTTCLPAGFQLQAGKFFSHFGRINQQHSHEWDFVDQRLIHKLTLGDHGLNEKGAQLSWLAPTPFHLLAGVEALQGENELIFEHIGGDELPDEDGPRVWVGWLKFSPNLPQKHGLQVGFFGGKGHHQEEHDEDDDGEMDHWLDGDSIFWGTDFVYKYDSHYAYGLGDFTLQGEYFWRKKDLDLYDTDPSLGGPPTALIGLDRIDKQDGYYIQALYGFLPRWRAGLRWEQVGLTNESEFPNGMDESYDDSYRLAGMLDFSPTEFSRLRLQVNKGEYELVDGDDDFWQFYMQLMISLGTHGAHKF